MKRFILLAAALWILPAISAAAPPRLPQNTAEDVAVETAISKGSVTRDDQSISYEGIYNGVRGPCDLVTVRVKYFPEVPRAGRTDIFNYQVCNGRIVDMGESAVTDFGIPDGIEDFAQGVARQAQKYGTATGDFQGFKVLGRAVRSQDKCSVEIKIMRDGKLYGQNILNGCQ